ncbi:DNA mismatch repair protein MutS [Anaplasmataceae bacterium AB001_6]|nr:DNA mismatch repair protein MutS [Anaplasmataceae bacterium AB001_6]
MVSGFKVTPSLKQYLDIKRNYSDCLLFYRMGDFYELFFEDAKIAARELDIVLTSRGRYEGCDIPMSGVPFHSAENRINKLVESGFKVAICEQIESADDAKKRGNSAVISRKVVRVVTKGTLINENFLDGRFNNYIMSISKRDDIWVAAWIDFTTREFKCASLSDSNFFSYLLNINPSEVLIPTFLIEDEVLQKKFSNSGTVVNSFANNVFAHDRNKKILMEYYCVNDVKTLNFYNCDLIAVCGVLVDYISYTQSGMLESGMLSRPSVQSKSDYVFIDSSVIKSLELFKTNDNKTINSLCHKIDKTLTSGGSRMFKNILSFPLQSIKKINNRLDAVEFLIKNDTLFFELIRVISLFPDLERAVTRICLKNSCSRDLLIIKKSLLLMNKIFKKLSNIKDLQLFNDISTNLNTDYDLYCILEDALVDREFKKDESGYIKISFSAKLRELSEIRLNADKLISDLVDKYRVALSCPKLKISSNNLIGYYIEVPSNINVNDDIFIYKQSLRSANRYTTIELMDLENKIVTAETSYDAIEKDILNSIFQKIREFSQELLEIAKAVSMLDVILSFTEISTGFNYCRPVIDESRDLIIKNGRHPVIDMGGKFIPNDLTLNEECKMYLLTGPNMAGKSTFLRQNAIIIIFSHIGCFIPASYAKIGLVDKIFSRVGSSDNLQGGKSTFMVEMEETASIINGATDRSFVILDEIGRGTSLRDGVAIAAAVIEYLHDNNKCRSIFATHYHELSDLEDTLPSMKNYFMEVDDIEGKIVFNYKILQGVSSDSYGIAVAKIAGLPESVISRACHFLRSNEHCKSDV